jgi:hypothetical protein
MDEIADQNQPVSHPLSLTCAWRIRAGQRPCGRRLLAAAVALAPCTGLEIIKRALAPHGECW